VQYFINSLSKLYNYIIELVLFYIDIKFLYNEITLYFDKKGNTRNLKFKAYVANNVIFVETI